MNNGRKPLLANPTGSFDYDTDFGALPHEDQWDASSFSGSSLSSHQSGESNLSQDLATTAETGMESAAFGGLSAISAGLLGLSAVGGSAIGAAVAGAEQRRTIRYYFKTIEDVAAKGGVPLTTMLGVAPVRETALGADSGLLTRGSPFQRSTGTLSEQAQGFGI